MTSHIQKMCRIAELPKIKFHSLRHHHVSVLIKMGVDINTIKQRLGHSTIKTTIDTYGHLLPGQDAEAALKYGHAIYGKDTEEKQEKGGNQRAMSADVSGFDQFSYKNAS